MGIFYLHYLTVTTSTKKNILKNTQRPSALLYNNVPRTTAAMHLSLVTALVAVGWSSGSAGFHCLWLDEGQL